MRLAWHWSVLNISRRRCRPTISRQWHSAPGGVRGNDCSLNRDDYNEPSTWLDHVAVSTQCASVYLGSDLDDIAETDWIYVPLGVTEVSVAVKLALYRSLQPVKLLVFSCNYSVLMSRLSLRVGVVFKGWHTSAWRPLACYDRIRLLSTGSHKYSHDANFETEAAVVLYVM